MEISLLLMRKIFSMLLMILVGFIMGRRRIVKEEDTVSLSLITMYFVCPAAIFCALCMEYTAERIRNLGYCILAALAVHIVYIGLNRLLFDRTKMGVGQRMSLIYTNAGNLLLPIIGSVLGSDALFYSCAFMIVQNCFIWSHEITMMTGSPKIQWKKLYLNPNILAIAFGLFLFFTRLSLPGPVMDAAAGVGSMMGPISMMLAGIIMGYADLKKAFSNREAYIVCAFRLIVYPMVIILLMKVIGAGHLFPGAAAVLMVPFLGACGPTASHVTQLARVNNRDYEEASISNMLSLLFCALSMPLMVYIYQQLIF